MLCTAYIKGLLSRKTLKRAAFIVYCFEILRGGFSELRGGLSELLIEEPSGEIHSKGIHGLLTDMF